MSLNKFISDTVVSCVKQEIDFKLYHKRTHQGCGGCFQEGFQLYACTKRPDWLDILVHETCHLDQALEEDSLWFKIGDVNPWEPQNPKLWRKAWKGTCDLEIDCDKRAVQKIRKYRLHDHLENGIANYIRRANCYHASYYYFAKFSCFYRADKIPYLDSDLVKEFRGDRILNLKDVWKENRILGDFIEKYNKPLKNGKR
jgi:hypothetical protein